MIGQSQRPTRSSESVGNGCGWPAGHSRALGVLISIQRCLGASGPRSLVLILAWSLVLAATGCVSNGKVPRPAPNPPASGSAIDELNLVALPMAVNVDEKPGPDGFVIKIFGSNRNRPKPFAIEKGKLEVLMFDGVPGMTQSASLRPRHVWNYTAEELRPFQIHSSIGTGYQLTLVWGDDKPESSRITVVARYTSSDGHVLTSAPSVISVAL